MITEKKEIKISVSGLCIGMFVSRLDRPWRQTPFELEGMLIRSPKDIEKLNNCCSFVYIDVEKGATPERRYWLPFDTAEPRITKPTLPTNGPGKVGHNRPDPYKKLRRTSYEDESELEEELLTADTILKKLEREFSNLLDDLCQGRSLDPKIVTHGVAAMVDSILRNPSAMMWIIQLKKLDEYTYSRALGTSVWCATFGRHLGLEKPTINEIALGGLLLDLGKSKVPRELLMKKGELNPEEKERMRSHVGLGIEILDSTTKKGRGARLPVKARQMVATHHERADGSGYPQGLLNDQIPIYGRIAGIVDSYDAMTSKRPYLENSDPLTPHKAIEELYALRGTRFQSELVEQFIQTVGLYPTGSLVELNTGQVGVVVATNGLRRLRPTVMLLLDADKKPMDQFRHLNLTLMKDKMWVVRGLPAGAYGIDMKELFL